MATTAQSVSVLSRALDQAANVLSAVPEDLHTANTPCGDWDVASLMAHVVSAPGNFLLMSSGGEPDWSATPSLPEDWLAEFRSAADALLRMWHQADEQTMADWQTAEFAVHTWDLARATGQSTDLDPEVAQRALDFMAAALTPENRGGVFGPAVAVPEDAPIYDRLAAFAGRDPGFTR